MLAQCVVDHLLDVAAPNAAVVYLDPLVLALKGSVTEVSPSMVNQGDSMVEWSGHFRLVLVECSKKGASYMALDGGLGSL